MPKTLGADALRDKALEMISASNEPVSAMSIQMTVLGDTKDVDEHRRRQQRLRHALINLIESKHIMKVARGYYQLNNGRPTPQVHDLPPLERPKGKKGRPLGARNAVHYNGATNGAANGDLKSYLIRDIRGKLAELEALI